MATHKPINAAAATIAFYAAGFFIVALFLLHVLKPEYDPTWRVISEYEIGAFGWLMQLAFYVLGVGSLALSVLLWRHLAGIGSKIGLALVVLAGLSMFMAGTFVSDPITTPMDQVSDTAKVHGIAASLGIPTVPIAMTLVSWGLVRFSRRWLRRITAPLLLMWGSFIAYLIANMQANGSYGPHAFIGWPNRLFIVAFAIWIIVIAWRGRQRSLG